MGALSEEEFGLRREKEDASVWKNLIERQGWKGKQLKRDLALAGESVGAVKDLRWNLEKARGSFLEVSLFLHCESLRGQGLITFPSVRVERGTFQEVRVAFPSEASHGLTNGLRSGLIGYHLAGHGLSAEEEVASLRHVLDDFRRY